MDAGPSAHPTPETLQAYGLGKLDVASAEVVTKHLEDCPDCRRLVTEITAAGAAGPSASPTGITADDAGVDSSSSPRISSTGRVEETSAALNGSDEPGLQPGTRVGYFGDYELPNVLGEGGMGIVYKARQLSLNRLVALKMIKASRFPSSDEVRRFQNEAEAVARLDHPNIVPIFEVGRYEDQHYFSMKLIAGDSLDKRLKDYVADPRRAARLMVETATAIHHAHQRGILHRDLKPGNILIDSAGQPHVSDFGLAKRIDGDSELTRSGAIVGTPAYMAPEQASGTRGSVTTSTDVYGLGAILYALLTGRAPFGGTTVLDVLEQVRERTPDPPRKLNRRVPRDLEVICLKCLEKEPRRRYASADAFTEDLKRWLAGAPIAARPVGNAARILMWCRRNPVVAGAAGLVAASLLVVVVLSLLYADRQARLVTTVTLRANEQTQHATKIAEDAARISAQASDLETQRQNLKASLADSNRRVATLFFERAHRAFDEGHVNHGLLWSVECWRYAAKADDRGWQDLARANISFWRYNCPEIKVFLPHGASVDKVAFSPDGKTVLTRAINTAWLWNAASGAPVGQAMTHPGYINTAIFSPGGKMILTGSVDRTARLWDATTGRPIGQPLKHQGPVRSVAFSPNGMTVLTGGDDPIVRLWDAATGRAIEETIEHKGFVQSVAYSSNGKTILTLGRLDKTLRLWDAATCQPISRPVVLGSLPTAAAFSPDGKTVLTGDFSNETRLWDVATGRSIGKPIQHEAVVSSMIYSPDGKTVLMEPFESNAARLWDATTWLPIGKPYSISAMSETWHSVLTERWSLLEAWTGRRAFGTPLPVSQSVSPWYISLGSDPWRIAPTARPSLQAASVGRGCGTPQLARSSACPWDSPSSIQAPSAPRLTAPTARRSLR